MMERDAKQNFCRRFSSLPGARSASTSTDLPQTELCMGAWQKTKQCESLESWRLFIFLCNLSLFVPLRIGETHTHREQQRREKGATEKRKDRGLASGASVLHFSPHLSFYLIVLISGSPLCGRSDFKANSHGNKVTFQTGRCRNCSN